MTKRLSILAAIVVIALVYGGAVASAGLRPPPYDDITWALARAGGNPCEREAPSERLPGAHESASIRLNLSVCETREEALDTGVQIPYDALVLIDAYDSPDKMIQGRMAVRNGTSSFHRTGLPVMIVAYEHRNVILRLRASAHTGAVRIFVRAMKRLGPTRSSIGESRPPRSSSDAPNDELLGAWLAKESVRDVYLTNYPAEAAVLMDKAIVGCLEDEVPKIQSLGRTLRAR
jgi:hypothetical protein